MIKLVALGPTPIDPPQYVVAYDPEAHDGMGYVESDTDPEEPLTFATVEEAIEFWRQSPDNRPLREDGKPNRPLTAFSVEFSQLPVEET